MNWAASCPLLPARCRHAPCSQRATWPGCRSPVRTNVAEIRGTRSCRDHGSSLGGGTARNTRSTGLAPRLDRSELGPPPETRPQPHRGLRRRCGPARKAMPSARRRASSQATQRLGGQGWSARPHPAAGGGCPCGAPPLAAPASATPSGAVGLPRTTMGGWRGSPRRPLARRGGGAPWPPWGGAWWPAGAGHGRHRAPLCGARVSCPSPLRRGRAAPARRDPRIGRRCCRQTAWGLNRHATRSAAALPNHCACRP